MMEVELKYLIDDSDVIDQLMKDEMILALKDQKEEEFIPMLAVYYDTEERDLGSAGIAYRIRREGNRNVCTVKWDGSSENGMHKRQEINIPLSDEDREPSLDYLEQADICSCLREIVSGKKLEPVLTMDFIRRQIRLDSGRSISVLSVDQGKISCGGRTLPIQEMEIELFSGDEADILKLGKKIAGKYGLKAEDRSKLERGIALAG